MHVREIFNDHLMGHPVKRFTEVDHGNNNSMGVLEIKMLMNELQQVKKIVTDGGAFDTKLVRIKVRLNYRDKPVSKKRFKHFAQETGFRDISQVVFTRRRIYLRKGNLLLYYPLSGIFKCS